MRDSMIFYRSFYEAIKELPKDEQANIYDAIFSYGLDFVEPVLSGISKTVWTLIKPQIDANIKRFHNGMQPKEKQEKSKPKAKRKQKKSETEANNNNNVNNNLNEECKSEEQLHALQKYVRDKFPTVSKMEVQLTHDNCVKLLEKYTNKQVSDTLIAMENYKPLLQKSKNVYLTLLTWLRKDENKTEAPKQPKMPYEEVFKANKNQ